MSGKTNQGRNTVGLISSVVLHLLLIGMVINQAPPDYQFAMSRITPVQPVPSEEPAIDVRILKLPVPPLKVTPAAPQSMPEPPPPQPPPPVPEQQPQPAPVVPAHPKILPPTPIPTPPQPTPTVTPAPPKPAPPRPTSVASPVAAPAPTTPAPAPRTAEKPVTVVTKATPTPAQTPPKAAPAAASTPLPLNIHRAALAAPAGVPTLPLAPSPGPVGKPGSSTAAATGAEPGAPGTSRLNGLTPYPYGFMPNGGGGLRGTLVGCANAEAVRLSSAERDKCNERFGDNIAGAPRLDPLSPAKRAMFDKASASDAAWARYRDSGAAPPNPSSPDGIAHGPASSVVLDHPASDYPPK